MTKRRIIWLAVLPVLLLAAFLTFKVVYERGRTIEVKDIPLQRYAQSDTGSALIEEVPLRLELTVKKHLFSSRLDIACTAYFDGDIQAPDELSGFSWAAFGQLVSEWLRSGVSMSANSSSEFRSDHTNPQAIHWFASANLPLNDTVPRVRALLSINVPGGSNHQTAGEARTDEILADEVSVGFAPGDSETAYFNRYLCDLTVLREALADICE